MAYYQKIYGEFTNWAEQAHQPFIGRINGHQDGDDSDGSWRSKEWLDVEDNKLNYSRTYERSGNFIGNFQEMLEITGGRWGGNVTLVRFQSSESRVIAEDGSLIPHYGELFNSARQFGENNTFELKFASDGTPLELEIISASGFRKEFPDTNLEFKLKFSNPEKSA